MAKEKLVVEPEDTYRKKLDMCITDAIIKGGGGILLGTIASIFIFKRRWPITTGFGIGMVVRWTWCNRHKPGAHK
ncbi:hypothetical protein PYW07_004171 [Mythimna separata]|uniref:MICOS complex subunit MIC10 n=1 Tax=Mythimna separata TaxID=271217 RepID=A0AAD7YNI5_MYTSE|nr:hypothetical protein PYW07_004171 [Mythimna separata]